jgi:LmbE family N-acetylglucosaminyl deacetylase
VTRKDRALEKRKFWFIGAHYDDIEIGCGGTAAKMISAGNECYATIVTKSGYKDETGKVIRDNEVAHREGMTGLKLLGFEENNISHLNFETGKLEHNLELIHSLEAEIKKIQPEIVFTHWTHDVHQDHVATAKATLTVTRKTGSVIMYRPNWYRQDVPFLETLFVDVSDYYSTKKAAINAHESEVKKFGSSWEKFINAQDVARGMEIGVQYAESFQLVKMKW